MSLSWIKLFIPLSVHNLFTQSNTLQQVPGYLNEQTNYEHEFTGRKKSAILTSTSQEAEAYEEIEVTGSFGRDRGHAAEKERMVSAVRSAIYHADSGKHHRCGGDRRQAGPADTLVMGNLAPAGIFRNGTPELVRKETAKLMGACSGTPTLLFPPAATSPRQRALGEYSRLF